MNETDDERRERIESNRKRALEIQKQKKEALNFGCNRNKGISPLVETSLTEVKPLSSSIQECDTELKCMQAISQNSNSEQSDQSDESYKQFQTCKNLLSNEFELLLQKSFGEQCCKSCQIRLRPDYETICKSTLVSEYLLPEGTIKMMKYYEKVNPKNPTWRPMNMYLRKHAKAKALERFGSLDSLEKEKHKREGAKLSKDLEAVSSLFTSSTTASTSHDDSSLLGDNVASSNKKQKTASKTKNVFKNLADNILSMKNK